MEPAFQIGDRVQMKKAHPCGSDQWQIYRIGADIGLRCLGCNRHVMLTRGAFIRQLKHVLRGDRRSEGEAAP